MYCGKCGAENVDGARFCQKCGQPLSTGEDPGVPLSGSEPSSGKGGAGGYSSQELKAASSLAANKLKDASGLALSRLKMVPKKVLIGCGVVLIGLIVIINIVANMGSTINLDDYLTVEAEGYDGYGTARTVIDWSAIDKKYGSKLSFTNEAVNEYGGLLSMMTPVDSIQECVSVELEETSGLSNGDSIAYTWDVDEDLTKYVKCKVKYSDSSYTVSGLTEVESFDAFADVEVIFSGISPGGMAEIVYSGSELNASDFSCDIMSGLKNGDEVEVSIRNIETEYYMQSIGKIPEETTKTYTVSGLQEYVDSRSDLTDDFMDNVKRESEDSIYAYTASSYNNSSSLNNLEYAGCILNAVKDGSGYIDRYNELYIIYKGDVSNSEGRFSTSKVYFPVRFSNILQEGDTFSYSNNDGIIGSSNLDGGGYSTKGYINPLVCYMEIVESNRDTYTAECADGFEAYAEYEKIEKLDDIDKSYKEVIYSDALDKIESYLASEYTYTNQGIVADNLSVKGEYLLLAKSQGTDFRNNNKYIVVYSATVSHPEGKCLPTIVYFPVEYDGIVKLPGDEYMVTASVGILGNSYLASETSQSAYSTRGYVDGTEMYSSTVTKNRDNYTYEVSDSLKEFGS